MKSSRIAVLCVLFFLDVHVRAESHPQPATESCWGQSLPCGVQTEKSKRDLEAQGFKLTMAAHSTLEQRDAKTVQLVIGDFYAEVDGNVRLNTPYAEIRCANACKGIFNREDTEITVKALGGQWVIKRLGDRQEYALHAGLQVRISEVQDDGVANMEFPQGLPLTPTLKEWAKFYRKDFKSFKQDVAVFRQEWESAVEKASQDQTENAKRSIASHQSELDKAKARRQAEARDEEALRRLFREKNDMNP